MGERRNASSSSTKIKISFREFIKVMLKMADGAYPKMEPPVRLTTLLNTMEKSGNFSRVQGIDMEEGATMLPSKPMKVSALPPAPAVRAVPPPVALPPLPPAINAATAAELNDCLQCKRALEEKEIDLNREKAMLTGQLRAVEKERDLLFTSDAAWASRYADLEAQGKRDHDLLQSQLTSASKSKGDMEEKHRRDQEDYLARITDLEKQLGLARNAVKDKDSSFQKEIQGSSVVVDQLQKQVASLSSQLLTVQQEVIYPFEQLSTMITHLLIEPSRTSLYTARYGTG